MHALREKDIMPFAYGNDYYWTTQLMVQSLDSLQDVVDASTGKASYTDPKFAAFGDGWKPMVDAKCFNDDVASVGISQASDAVRRRRGRDDGRHRRRRAPVGQGPRGRRRSWSRSGPCSATAR